MRNPLADLALTFWLFLEVSDACHYYHVSGYYYSFDRQALLVDRVMLHIECFYCMNTISLFVRG